MKWAARGGDATAHGGSITPTQMNVFICGQPAARVNDPHICSQHGGGVVTQGSWTVFIGNSQVARKDDLCHCLSVGVSGTGVPGQVSPEQVVVQGSHGPISSEMRRSEDWTTGQSGYTANPIPGVQDSHQVEWHVPDSFDNTLEDFETSPRSDHDRDGTPDTVSGDGAIASGRYRRRTEVFGAHRESSTEIDLGYAEGSAGTSGDTDGMPGLSGRAQGEAGTVRVTDRESWGLFGHDIYTEESRAHGPRVWGTGDATGIGDDGRDVGGGHYTAGGGADVVQAQKSRRVDIGVLELEVGAEVGSGWGYTVSGGSPHYDRVDDEVQWRGQLAGFWALGAGGWAEIEVHPFLVSPTFYLLTRLSNKDNGGTSGPGSGPIPNTIVTGCPTVFIGG